MSVYFVIGDEEAAVVGPPGVEAGLCLDGAEQADGAAEQLDVRVGGPKAPDEPRGVPGGARSQPVTL